MPLNNELALSGLSKDELLELVEKYIIMVDVLKDYVDHSDLILAMTEIAIRIKEEVHELDLNQD